MERALPEEARTETTLADRFSAQGLSATGVRFGVEANSDLDVVGMEFAERADFGSTAPLGADDETVLAGIAELLQGRGKIDRFGVKLIRNPLGLAEHQLLLETCDSENRTLHCDVSSRDAMPGDVTIVETTWQWKVLQGETRPVVMQDCTAGRIAVGESHDLKHGHSGMDDDDNPIGPIYP